MTVIHQSNIPLDDLIQHATTVLEDGTVTFGELVSLGGVLAGKVNRFEQLSGHQKQAMVLEVVERALQKICSEKLASLPEEQRDEFQKKIESASSFAKETLPSVLTLAVQASRGQLNLGKVVEVVTSEEGSRACWSLCRSVAPCMRLPQAPPSKAAIVAGLEMRVISDPQSSKEPQTPLPEDKSKIQESREASTVAQ